MKKIAGLILVMGFAAGLAADPKKDYEQHCIKCHGATGAGDGSGAVKLKAKMKDWRTAKAQGEFDDKQAFDAIKNGSKATSIKVGKKMPAFGKKLSDAQIDEQVKLIRSFKK